MRCPLNAGTVTAPGAQVYLVSHWSDLLEHLGRAHDSNWNIWFADVTVSILHMLNICSAIFMKCVGDWVTQLGPHHHDSQNMTPVISFTLLSVFFFCFFTADNWPVSYLHTSQHDQKSSLGLLITGFMKFNPKQLHTGMIRTAPGYVALLPVSCQQILNLSC